MSKSCGTSNSICRSDAPTPSADTVSLRARGHPFDPSLELDRPRGPALGARCAGSPMAILLARAGLRVCVVDRARFPSDTASTHGVQPSGVKILERLGVLEPLLEVTPPIERGTIAFDEARIEISNFTKLVGAPMLSARRLRSMRFSSRQLRWRVLSPNTNGSHRPDRRPRPCCRGEDQGRRAARPAGGGRRRGSLDRGSLGWSLGIPPDARGQTLHLGLLRGRERRPRPHVARRHRRPRVPRLPHR